MRLARIGPTTEGLQIGAPFIYIDHNGVGIYSVYNSGMDLGKHQANS